MGLLGIFLCFFTLNSFDFMFVRCKGIRKRNPIAFVLPFSFFSIWWCCIKDAFFEIFSTTSLIVKHVCVVTDRVNFLSSLHWTPPERVFFKLAPSFLWPYIVLWGVPLCWTVGVVGKFIEANPFLLWKNRLCLSCVWEVATHKPHLLTRFDENALKPS